MAGQQGGGLGGRVKRIGLLCSVLKQGCNVNLHRWLPPMRRELLPLLANPVESLCLEYFAAEMEV